MKFIRYLIAIIRIKITKDYGMCSTEESARKCIREYYLGK